MERRTVGWRRVAGGLVLAGALVAAGCTSPAERFQKHLAAGDRYLATGHLPEAVISYNNALKVSSDDHATADLYRKLGDTYVAMNDPSDLSLALQSYVHALFLEPDDPVANMAAGRIELMGGDAAGARDRADAVLTRAPDHLEARLLKAQALTRLNQPDDAAAVYEAVLKDHPDLPVALVGLAAVRSAQGRAKEAEAAYRAAVAAAPDSLDLRLQLGGFLVRAGRPADAEAAFEAAIAAHPAEAAPYLALSRLYLAGRGADAAAKVLDRLVAAAPDAEAGYRARGDLMRVLGHPDDARAAYEEGIEKAKEPAGLRVRLADLLLAQGKLDEVEAQAKALDQTADGHWVATMLGGLVALARNHPADAVTALDRAVRERPDVALAQYHLGRAQLAAGDPVGAVDRFQAALARDPDLIPARIALAQTRLGLGALADARGDVARLVEMAPNLPDTMLLQGTLALAQDEPEAALAAFTRLTRVVPDGAEGFQRLGEVNLALGRTQAAEAALAKAVALDPARLDALESLVELDVTAGHPERAEKRVRDQLAGRPESAPLLGLLGQVRIARKDRDGAIAAFQASIQADPDFMPGYAGLGSVYAQSDADYAAAVENLTRASEGDANLVGAHMLLATLHEQHGETDKAISDYRALLDANPGFVPAANNLAWLYAGGHGNLDVALGLAQTAREQAPDDPNVADTLGWIYHLKGFHDKALGLFDEALAQMPDEPSILYHAGVASIDADKPDRARGYLTKALAGGRPFPEREAAEAALKSIGTG